MTAYRQTLGSLDLAALDDSLVSQTDDIEQQLSASSSIRQQFQHLDISAEEAVGRYTNINDALMAMIGRMTHLTECRPVGTGRLRQSFLDEQAGDMARLVSRFIVINSPAPIWTAGQGAAMQLNVDPLAAGWLRRGLARQWLHLGEDRLDRRSAHHNHLGI